MANMFVRSIKMIDLEGDFELADVADIDLDIDGQVMPPKNDKIALIDADTIAYTACLNSEVAVEVLPRDFYSDEEWQALLDNPNFVEAEGVVYEADVKLAMTKANEKLQRIMDKTGCQKFELHFTGGKDNFRYSIYPEYKASRTVRRPAGLVEVKKELAKKFGGTIHTKWEADDAVVYNYTTNPDKYILCAIDKDVLNSVEGKHFNYYESAQYNIEMKWHETDRYKAIVWPFLQTLMGDTSDNIKGLRGIGPAKAQKILDGCLTRSELWAATKQAYRNQGRPESDALLNMNLVNMHLLKGDKIVLLTDEELSNED